MELLAWELRHWGLLIIEPPNYSFDDTNTMSFTALLSAPNYVFYPSAICADSRVVKDIVFMSSPSTPPPPSPKRRPRASPPAARAHLEHHARLVAGPERRLPLPRRRVPLLRCARSQPPLVLPTAPNTHTPTQPLPPAPRRRGPSAPNQTYIPSRP